MPITFTSISWTAICAESDALTVLRKPGKKTGEKPLDCHLMVTRPQDYIAQLAVRELISSLCIRKPSTARRSAD